MKMADFQGKTIEINGKVASPSILGQEGLNHQFQT